MITVVIDPGVLVSAFISRKRTAPALIVEALLDERLTVVVCPHLIDELRGVLDRAKFARFAADGRAAAFIDAIVERATFTSDPATIPPATEDPDDDYLIALAGNAGADAIVSGDGHLCVVDSEAMPVWTPREAIEALERREYGERYLTGSARVLIGLRQAAGMEHLAMVIVREAGEALVLHVTPERDAWYGTVRAPELIAELKILVSTIRTEDEEDVTARARAFIPEEAGATAPIDDLFGACLLASVENVGAGTGLLMARDAVERTWLAWRYEHGSIISVEETPAFFDEQLKAIDRFAVVPVTGNQVKPPLRLAAVGDPRTIALTPEIEAVLDAQAEAFRAKFGREMGPDDPVFFDPDADDPQPLRREQIQRISAVMEELGFGEEFRQRQASRLVAEGKVIKTGRNDPCPCGSGKKFKQCCGA